MTVSRKLLYPVPLVLAALFAGINWVYWPLVLKSGVLAPEADSVAIPMFGGLIISPVLALVLAVWSAPAQFRAPENIDLLVSAHGARAIFGNALYGGAALVGLIASALVFSPQNELIDALWLIWLVPFCLWNLLLRAAFVDRRPHVA